MPKQSIRKRLHSRATAKYHSTRKKRRIENNEDTLQQRKTTKQIKLGPLKKITTYKCPRCEALLFNTDCKTICCGRGLKNEYGLIDLPKLPQEYVDLYRSSKEFCRRSRAYNNLVAFSALGTTGGFLMEPGGPSSITLHGRTYHRMLNGNDRTGPLRWFVTDASTPKGDALEHELDAETVEMLENILSNCNYFWDRFKRFSELPSENIRLEFTVSSDREVAAVICDSDSGEPESRAVVCWKTTNREPTFIKTTNALYLPLQYVLLFPCGTLGWDITMKKTKNLTLLKYCRQLILRHEPLQYLGQLHKEFAVDCFSMVEDERLQYLQFNQQKICPRRELREALETGDSAGRTYLPPSHVHSPRYMREQTADALALVGRFGKPTYFITITCNPGWPEITSQLKPGQDATDRPDVVARVFKARLHEIIEDLPKALNGGKVIYRIHVIEFQKRGLPHAHIAIKMSNEPLSPEEVDEVINAEIPTDDEELRSLVLKHMIHGHVKDRCFKKKRNLNVPNADGSITNP